MTWELPDVEILLAMQAMIWTRYTAEHLCDADKDADIEAIAKVLT